jgi:23S rRNA (guanosine2251-2'-O)-methyltransferase
MSPRPRQPARRTSSAGGARTPKHGTVNPGVRRAPAARNRSVVDPDSRAAQHRGLGGEQIEGRQAVRELLSVARRRTRQIWMVAGNDPAPILDEIEALAGEKRVPVRVVSRDELAAVARTEAPQGVLAMADPLAEVDYEALLRTRADGRLPFLLAVDGITDPYNLGALLRSAECAGVTGVLLPRHRSVHITPTVAKASAGAIERLPMAVVGGLPSAVLRMKAARGWVVGLDMEGTTPIHELGHLHDVPLMLVIGSEGSGLARLTRERCDVFASIPMRGNLESLNASAAGAIALFELGRPRS